MNIALIGYGRMGREIEVVAKDRDHAICVRVDPVDPDADARVLCDDDLKRSDVAIEFSLAAGVVENATRYSRTNTPAVVGTTGWDDSRAQVEALFVGSGALIAGSNFSIGANLFISLVERAAWLVRDIESFDILMYEIHHRRKADSPSGTALSIAEKILSAGKKRKIVTERLDRAPEPDELHVGSVRGGEVPGIHTVMIDSAADTIELRHTARNRGGFALGAVLAAEWIIGRTGVFTIEDFIQDLIGIGGNV